MVVVDVDVVVVTFAAASQNERSSRSISARSPQCHSPRDCRLYCVMQLLLAFAVHVCVSVRVESEKVTREHE